MTEPAASDILHCLREVIRSGKGRMVRYAISVEGTINQYCARIWYRNDKVATVAIEKISRKMVLVVASILHHVQELMECAELVI